MVTDRNALWDAFADAIAVAKEWDGASVEEKLRLGFGLEAADVKAVLTERYEAYRRTGSQEEQEMFVQAMLEGLLAGMKVRPESRDVA